MGHVTSSQVSMCSVGEVEVVVCIIIILTLTKTRHYEVESCWNPGKAEPNTESEITNPSLDNETFKTSVHKVEKPLLGSV